jgi:hypothetical protein
MSWHTREMLDANGKAKVSPDHGLRIGGRGRHIDRLCIRQGNFWEMQLKSRR